jgi:aminopeptidase N
MRFDSFRVSFIIFLMAFGGCQSARSPVNQRSAPRIETIPNAQPTSRDTLLVRNREAKIEEYRASRTRKFDLIHTDLHLSFDYQNQWVNGEAVLTLKPFFFSQSILELDAQDFDIHGIYLQGNGEEQELNFKYDTQVATLYLPKTFTSSDTLRVRMRYTAQPNENAGGGSAAITDTKGLYFINPQGNENKPVQIWTQGETEHNSKWFPTIDAPNERATQEIRLTVNPQYRTLSNGLLVSSQSNADGTRTDRWIMDKPHAPYLAAVVVGEFEEIRDEWNGIQVNYYVEKEFAAGAKKVFGNTPEMIGFFSDLLGVRYPWQKYDQVVVRDFVSGAMENTTLTVFMEQLNEDERGAIDSEWDGIIAHELFHQWFGNYVTTESWANLTLNEAFANYSEYLWYEYKNGKDEADLHHLSEMEQYFRESKEKQVDLIRFYYEDPEDMFDSHSYAKGGRILHMLRRHLGDEAFFKSLNYYLTRHAFSSVEVHDLRLAFEEVTGMDMNWFFNQWFLASGHPQLAYEVDYSIPGNLLLTVTQKQDLTNTPLYRIPFKVSWYVNGDRKEKELVLDKGWQQFAIENEVPLDHLFVDEAFEILSEKISNRGREFFIRQFEKSELGIARYEALDSLGTQYGDHPATLEVVVKAMDDPLWAIREMALMQLAQHPEWIGQLPDVEEKVLHIAENDSKNSVRLGAIELLGVLDGDKYASSFLRWMNNPSYYVAGAALGAYLENENNLNRDEVAARFVEEKNIRMLVALAEYYLTAGKADKGIWFNEKLEMLSGESLYYFLGYYGEYFTVHPEAGAAGAVEKLAKIAGTHQASYVRIGAISALFGFIDTDGVIQMVKGIQEREEDPMVLRYLEYFIGAYGEKN